MHLVLLPGMDGTGELFAPLIESLPGVKTTVVSYPKDTCLDWEELLQIVESSVPVGEPITLVAESFSGPLAIKLASQRSHNVKSLVLCCSFASNPVPRWFGFLPVPKLAFKAMPRFAIRKFLSGLDSSDELVVSIQNCVKSVAPSVLANRARMIQQVDVRRELQAVEIPVLYLSGLQDRVVSDRLAEEVKSLQPRSTHIALDGPHLLLQYLPKIAAAEILKFLMAEDNQPLNGTPVV
jgi:pimeloyl-ACP methyl ester carboxylesterase